MIRALAHLPNHDFTDQVDLHSVQNLLKGKRTVLWLDVEDPVPEELALLKEQFGLHELAVEDASHPHQRPKLEEYEGFYFAVFYAIEVTEPGDRLALKELDLFVGEDYIVAVHTEPIREIEEGLRRWRHNHDVLGHGVGALLYSLLDSIVDNYFDAVDTLAERVGDLEELIYRGLDQGTVQMIFARKKQLLALRRVLGPERDALNTLMRQDIPLLDRRTLPYLRDVYDHVVRITDTVDLQNDLLSSGMDAYLSSVSNQLNQVMKRLTSVTVILMTMALIAGIYGMNFVFMPELQWEYGYAWALGTMVVSALALYVYLRRKGWF